MARFRELVLWSALGVGIVAAGCVSTPDVLVAADAAATTSASGAGTGGGAATTSGSGGSGGQSQSTSAGGGASGSGGGGGAGGVDIVCQGGTSLCGQACVDTDVDPANCGGCDNACLGGQVCSMGTCGLTCVGGTTKCGGVCTETDFDLANCGGCGVACPVDEVCSMGACGLDCVGGTTKCGSLCVETDWNPMNCGGCDVVCGAGEVCSLGSCGVVCLGGTTNCAELCVDTEVDTANCGACGSVCPAGQVCSQGMCDLTCAGGTTKCGNACVDTDQDPANCGGCGLPCGSSQSCVAGACTCPLGLTACGTSCVDPANDPLHCGNCASACNAGQTCKLGVCGGCTTNAECGANQVCASGVCQVGPPTTGLRFWVDAGIGVVKNAANQVSLWKDQSGYGLDLAQATVSNQPIWNASGGPNNKPYVAFPGSTDYMQTALDLTLNQPETVFLVVNQHSHSAGCLMDGYTYGNGFICQIYGAPNLAPYAGGNPGYAVATGNELALSTWGLLSVEYNVAQSWLQVNQILPTHNGNLGAAALQGVTLGCVPPQGAVGGCAGGNADVYFAEILIYGAALSNAEVANVQAYLDAKYNLY